MPIYKSTFIKFIKSASTWFPLIVILFIVSMVGAVLPLVLLDLKSASIIQTYKLYIVASITTIGSSTSIVSAAFAAYKSVQIYKQEIEEGTFLVLVSKPLSRKRIIFEKWLALLTIIAIYTSILISFYIFLVLILDPGNKIANLDIPPLRNQIFAVGFIVMIIVFILTLMFSSIALIISSKLGSSATIALVAGLGAIIPITGILPTFTQKQPLNMITPPVNILSTNKIPRQETIAFINKIINDEDINNDNIIDLFNMIKNNDKKIDNNKKYIKNLGITSGELDLYSNLHFFDLNYQISTIATIASDLLIPKQDRDFIAANAIAGGGFIQSPTLGGKINISHSNIKISQLADMLLETIRQYEDVTQNEIYTKSIYPFFDYILRSRKIPHEETTNDNFGKHLMLLMISFEKNNISSEYNLELQKFLSSPIINTILDDPQVDEKDKGKLQNKDEPFRGEIKAIEILLLLKMNISMGTTIELIIHSNFVENFYNKNDISKFTTISEAQKYLSEVNDTNINLIIENYFKIFNDNYNEKSIIKLSNFLLLSEKSKGGISSFEIGTYSNKWVVFSVYILITFGLLPISYLVIKKQDIR